MTADEQAKVLDRVQKLLRLAANNPNEEEARTAAMQAVKLIANHKLAVTCAQPVTPPHVPMPPYQSPNEQWYQAPRTPDFNPFWNPEAAEAAARQREARMRAEEAYFDAQWRRYQSDVRTTPDVEAINTDDLTWWQRFRRRA